MGRLLVGTRKGLLLFEQLAGRWKPTWEAHEAIPVSYADLDRRTGHLWACLDHGHWGCKLHHSADSGATWNELVPPRYPEGAEVRPGQAASLKYLWVWGAGGKDQPRRHYLGTEPGGLFKSDDEGENWQLVEGLWNQPGRHEQWFGGGRDEAGIHSILVDPRDSRRVLVGISCAGVFESSDDTITWQPRNRGLEAEFLPDPQAEIGHDPHFMEWCPAQPDVIWQQNHCGIFRSTDGGQSWTNVSQAEGPARFGFAIAVHETRPEVAWVVPARSDEVRVPDERSLCVCRSEDGGKSWTDLRQGLPQTHCYDIVYRHALDLCGEKLAFGSTTGNLFCSNDGGDHWETISHHLPPIYSVRWV